MFPLNGHTPLKQLQPNHKGEYLIHLATFNVEVVKGLRFYPPTEREMLALSKRTFLGEIKQPVLPQREDRRESWAVRNTHGNACMLIDRLHFDEPVTTYGPVVLKGIMNLAGPYGRVLQKELQEQPKDLFIAPRGIITSYLEGYRFLHLTAFDLIDQPTAKPILLAPAYFTLH